MYYAFSSVDGKVLAKLTASLFRVEVGAKGILSYLHNSNECF